MQAAVAAGEVSGDQILASILRALSQQVDLTPAGIAGPHLVDAGVYPLFPMERLSVMGVMEVLPRLPELLSMRRQMTQYLECAQPEALITCDAPDFNLPLQGRAKALGIPAIHVVSPSVWAWRAKRIPKIAKQLDALLCLFPFEPALYEGTGLKTCFIGHPLTQMIDFNPNPEIARQTLELPPATRYLAILPGSRQGEVSRLLPIFLAAYDRLRQQDSDMIGVIPAATPALHRVIQARVGTRPIQVVAGHAHEVLAASDAVLVASGTAALEAILTGRPTVAAYRMHPWTYRMVRSKLTTTHVTLPNILAETPFVPEFLQDAATPAAIAAAVGSALDAGQTPEFVTQARAIYDRLAGPVATRAANFIRECV
jgi:lipid-A-disaccharide synthase